MTITEQLDAIEQRAEAATAGEWGYYWGWDMVYTVRDGRRTIIADYCHITGDSRASEQIRDDMAFHATARKDVPKLVAALRHALDVAGEMRQGSHQDRIMRHGDMIGKIAGILASQGAGSGGEG